jgi:two-component system invasion response regulator UvrY
MPDKIRLAVADDHMLFRKGLIELLTGFEDLQVIIEAADGRELIDKIAAAEVLPDICLLDLKMPRMNGYEALPLLRTRWNMKVLVLSMYDHDFSVLAMIHNGAAGFINKDTSPDALYDAILSIHKTGTCKLPYDLRDKADLYRGKKEAVVSLTPREIEFLSYCCTELTYSEIAVKMSLSVRTIEGFRETLFEKLGIHNRPGLVTFALDCGLVPHDAANRNQQ